MENKDKIYVRTHARLKDAMKGLGFRLLIVVLGVFLAQCAVTPKFNVHVDSLVRADSMPKRSYVLISGNKEISNNDLQFQEYATYVHRALAARGFLHATRITDADIVVLLSYGISGPQTHYDTYYLPIWGETGYSSSTTYGTLNMFGGYGTYSSTTTYTPTYGITGFSTYLRRVTTYSCFILLEAYDLEIFKREDKLVQVWRTMITSTGPSGDLRRVFPVMLAGAAEHLATNTGQTIQINLDEENPAVQYIKGVTRR